MTKDNIITLPNPCLRRRSQKVADIDERIKSVIEGMKAATLDWEAARAHEVGVALAAIQINELLKIVVIRANPDDKNSRAFNVFINPEITKYEGEIVNDYEGCLSIVDIYGMVPRYSKVRVKAINEAGQEFRVKAEGFLARILQHEIDHTNGKLFIDYIKHKKRAFYQLTKDGKLSALDYEKDIKNNNSLWV